MNKCSFYGRLTKDPELRYLADGTAKTYFNIAVSEKVKDKEYTQFIDFVAFGRKAEIIAEFFQKGTRILVEDAKYKSYFIEKDGEKKYYHSFDVKQFSFVEKKGE